MPNVVPRILHPGRWLQGMSDALDRFLPDRGRGEEEETGLLSMFEKGGPAIEVVDRDDEIRVTADLPGVGKDDFKVEVVGDRLILRGEKKSNREEWKGDYYYSERSYGSFARTVRLPAEIDPDKAEATFKNGELSVRLPKTEAAKARRTKVRIE